MKKIAVVLISFVMMFTLAACDGSPASTVPKTDSTSIPMSSEKNPAQSDEHNSSYEDTSTESKDIDKTAHTLVVYFSATGNTKNVAEYIAEAAGADLFELEPKEPYTKTDLDWTNENSRVSLEHDNPNAQNVELVADTVDDWVSYDTVFVGFPIWWGIAAWPVNGFVKSNDFTGKTVIPFCTSGGSGLGESGKLLEQMTGTGEWLEGQQFSSGASKEDVCGWVESLELDGAMNSVQISITVGEDVLYADLYNSELTKEFIALLPQTISMQRVGGGREFYGILNGSLGYDVADSQTTFENGDVAYWYSGNGFCLFYNDQVEDTTVNSGIIVFGKITSDFSVLHELEDRAEMTVDLVE